MQFFTVSIMFRNWNMWHFGTNSWYYNYQLRHRKRFDHKIRVLSQATFLLLSGNRISKVLCHRSLKLEDHQKKSWLPLETKLVTHMNNKILTSKHACQTSAVPHSTKNHCKTLIALDSVYFTQGAKYEAPDMSYYCNTYYT